VSYIAGKAAVASIKPLGTRAGADLLRAGGNAVDAAIGAMLVECVSQPQSVGIAGYGGVMTIYIAREHRVACVDFNSIAPRAVKEDMFKLDPDAPGGIGESGLAPVRGRVNEYGGLSLTVPGNIAGLALALSEYGTMSWAEVSKAAIHAAENGTPVDADLAAALRRFADNTDDISKRAFFGDRAIPSEGELLFQPDLAKLMRKLADEGPEAFYGPEIAGQIIKRVEEIGGILQIEDFSDYSPTLPEPISVSCGSFELFTAPVPTGGLTSLEIVKAMHALGINEEDFAAGRYHHLLIEITKLAWQDRLELFGDPAFTEDHTERLLSEDHIKSILSRIPDAVPADAPTCAESAETHTVHTVAADAEGNLASLTATMGGHFGSRIVVDGLGIALGHGMSRFHPVPGHPNSIAPGKRPLHNMSPMILLRDGKPYCAFGLPGGRKIVNVSAQLALGFIEFGMIPAQAIAMPRIHTEGFEPITITSDTPGNVLEYLEARGHNLNPVENIGMAPTAAMITPEGNRLAASQTGKESSAVV